MKNMIDSKIVGTWWVATDGKKGSCVKQEEQVRYIGNGNAQLGPDHESYWMQFEFTSVTDPQLKITVEDLPFDNTYFTECGLYKVEIFENGNWTYEQIKDY